MPGKDAVKSPRTASFAMPIVPKECFELLSGFSHPCASSATGITGLMRLQQLPQECIRDGAETPCFSLAKADKAWTM